MIKGDRGLASEALVEADAPELLDLFTWATTPSLRGGVVGPSRDPLPRDEQPRRVQPPVTELRRLHARDGYRCRYCSIRVIERDVFARLRRLLPEAVRWGRTNVEQHAAFLCLRATHDHVLPRAFGGANSVENYVTACWLCQFAHGDSLLEDLGVEDPRVRRPVVDGWDGMRGLLRLRA